MVQLEPNLTLTLKHLATCGAVLSAEQQAATDHSLAIKRVEAGLRSLVFWGRITTLNGKDYLIAEGTTESTYDSEAKRVSIHARLFYSQDAVKWIDLQAVSKEAFARILKNKSLLTGDASTVFTISEDGTATAAEEEAGDDAEGKGAKFTELEVLRARVDAINAATGVVPVGCTVLDALNRVVPNRLFGGVPYPEKLEAYMHRTSPPGGATLAADLRGTWSVQSDPFKSVAICRSLLWPGYFFYYNGHELTWGSMYYGNGIRNNDLVFML